MVVAVLAAVGDCVAQRGFEPREQLGHHVGCRGAARFGQYLLGADFCRVMISGGQNEHAVS